MVWLIPTEKNDNTSLREYGMYRIQVDLIGYKLLGGKTLFYLMDALWAADREVMFPLTSTLMDR
ncbi:MAG: hypothetical protein ACM34O_10700 [Ignavibacteria bacterium]